MSQDPTGVSSPTSGTPDHEAKGTPPTATEHPVTAEVETVETPPTATEHLVTAEVETVETTATATEHPVTAEVETVETPLTANEHPATQVKESIDTEYLHAREEGSTAFRDAISSTVDWYMVHSSAAWKEFEDKRSAMTTTEDHISIDKEYISVIEEGGLEFKKAISSAVSWYMVHSFATWKEFKNKRSAATTTEDDETEEQNRRKSRRVDDPDQSANLETSLTSFNDPIANTDDTQQQDTQQQDNQSESKKNS